MAKREDIPSLTGLRGVAILLVVHAHYMSWCSPFSLTTVSPTYVAITATSAFGMSLFFTLSGFVIAYHYWDFGWRDAPAASLWRFLGLRVSRLYPVLVLFLVLRLKHTVIDHPFYPDGDWGWPAVVHFLSLQSWYPARVHGELADADAYTISWSISTEIGMYLIFACALAATARLRHAKAILLTAGAGLVLGLTVVSLYYVAPAGALLARLPALYEPVDNPGTAWRWFFYVSPYFRLAQFALGAGAAALVTGGWDARLRPVLSIATAIALAALGYLFVLDVIGVGYSWTALGELMHAVCFAIVIANARAPTRVNRVLSSGPLIFFGLVSYSLYLFHGIATNFAGSTPIKPFAWNLVPEYLFSFALSLTFAAVIAWGLYSLVEMPAQRWLRAAVPQAIRRLREWAISAPAPARRFLGYRRAADPTSASS